MGFGNSLQRQQNKNPLKIQTSVSTTAPMSNSIPFPIDETRVQKVRSNASTMDINDPQTFRPRAEGIHVDLILQQAIITGWLTKHRVPTFSFMKNIKRRYVVLVDRMLYAFKSESPEIYREFLELTVTTHAFVTDQLSGASYCIEIKKMGYDDSWYLQADDAETMKVWLDRIKRTISLLRAGHTGTITKSSLSTITTEEEEYLLVAANTRRKAIYDSSTSSNNSNISIDTTSTSSIVFPLPPSSFPQHHSSQPSSPTSSHCENASVSSFQSSAGFSTSEYSMEQPPPARRKSSLRVARTSFSTPTAIPPQLPPPKSQPPPIPSYAYL